MDFANYNLHAWPTRFTFRRIPTEAEFSVSVEALFADAVVATLGVLAICVGVTEQRLLATLVNVFAFAVDQLVPG